MRHLVQQDCECGNHTCNKRLLCNTLQDINLKMVHPRQQSSAVTELELNFLAGAGSSSFFSFQTKKVAVSTFFIKMFYNLTVFRIRMDQSFLAEPDPDFKNPDPVRFLQINGV